MAENKSNLTVGEDFVIERTYDAPVSLVWQAITERGAIKQWFVDFEEFEPKVGCEFHFTAQDHDNVSWLHRCVVTEVIPLKKLAYSWRFEGYEGDTLVTMELFDEAGKSRVKLTHAGLDNLAKIPAFARENFVAGWTEIVGSLLKNYVEKQVQH